jgi:hypothetical protein
MVLGVPPEADQVSKIIDLNTQTLPLNGQLELTRTGYQWKFMTLAFSVQSDYYEFQKYTIQLL